MRGEVSQKPYNRQRIDFIRRSVTSGFYPADLQRFGDLLAKADDQVLNDALHVLRFTLSSCRVSLQQVSK